MIVPGQRIVFRWRGMAYARGSTEPQLRPMPKRMVMVRRPNWNTSGTQADGTCR